MGGSLDTPSPPLSSTGRMLVLGVAFLGWLCAGMLMSITQLAGQAAAIDLLSRSEGLEPLTERAEHAGADELSAEAQAGGSRWKERVARWFAWYQCAFLFGAATGGLVFGWLGDQVGRAKGMALSILTYSGMAGAAYFVQSPVQLLVVWYLACLGVGGMWPNGVALVAEAWSSLSRPMAAGVIGTAANVGIFLMATIAASIRITPEEWRWVMLVGAAPVVLGLFSLLTVPESPRWRAAHSPRAVHDPHPPPPAPMREVFRPPWLGGTIVGIALATVPLIGGWGSANWMIPWAGEAGEAASPPDPYLKAHVGQARALTGIVGSLLGGWIASVVGRRRTYFLVSLVALGIAQYTFWFVVPTDRLFLMWVAALGFFSGIYFGWLPLFLPELFPTRIRSTGAGVSFNFGRILTAATIFATGALMVFFEGDYARIGRATSLIYAVGILAACFVPDSGGTQLED